MNAIARSTWPRSLTAAGLALLGAVLGPIGLAGCSTAASSTASAAASPSAGPTFGFAPSISDVCATVDKARVDALSGRTDLSGSNHPGSNHPGVIAPVGTSQRVCTFGLPPDPTLYIGIAPIPMLAAIPGPEEALRDYMNMTDYNHDQLISGVGELAIYQPADELAGPLLVAVHGSGLRYYGITIRADDPTPGRTVLGGVTKADLVDLANHSLAHL